MERDAKVNRRASMIVAGLACGACWGLIALVLWTAVAGAQPHYFRGGLLASPLIGLLAVSWSRVFPPGGFARVLFALLGLYAAAALFGLSMGLFDFVFGQTPGTPWSKSIAGALLEPFVAVLWGLTFMGLFIPLWPLSFLTHLLFARLWESPRDEVSPA